MPVYDFSSGFNALNRSIDAFGGALKQADQSAYQQDSMQKVNDGDWTGAMALTAKRGDLDTWTKLQSLKTQTGPAPTLDSLGGGTPDVSASATSSTAASSTPTTPGVSPGYGGLARPDVSNLLISKARDRGIDPGKALKVYSQEGASNYVGDDGSSFGPLQLHMGGISAKYPQRGMGDDFKDATGLDPRDPSTVPQQIDFALDQAAKNGWGPWSSQKGRDPFEGIGSNAQPRGVSVAGQAGVAVPGGQQIAPAGMGLPQFATSTATPPQQFGRSTTGTPMRAIGPSVTALTTPGKISPAAGGIVSTPGALAANAAPLSTGALPPMPQMVNQQGQPVTPLGKPVQVASVGGTAGLTAPGAAPLATTPTAGAPAADVAISVPGYKGTFTRAQALATEPEGDDAIPDSKEWDAAAKVAGVSATSAAPTAAGGVSPPSVAPQAVAAMSSAPPQYQAAARGFLGRLDAMGAPGTPRRTQTLEQAVIVAQQNALHDSRWKPIGDALAIQYKAESDLANRIVENALPPAGYKAYEAQEIAAGRTPLSQNDWQHQSKDPDNFIQLITPEERAAHGIDPSDKRVWNYNIRTHKAEPTATGGPLVSNVIGAGESEESKKSAEFAATRKNEMITAANTATGKIARLRLLGNVLATTPTGPLAGAYATVGGVALQLGVSPEVLSQFGYDPTMPATADIAKKLAAELVVGSIGAKNGGFPASNFSVAERQFVETLFPQMANQPGANEAVKDVLIARHKHEQLEGQEWAAYKKTQKDAGKNPSYEDFEDEFRQKHGDDNIFQPIMDKYNSGGYSPTGAPPPKPLANIGERAPVAAGQQGAPIRIPAGMTPAQIKSTYGGKGGVRIILPDGGEGFVP